MKAPHVNAEPWGTASPIEADLYELTPKLEEGEVGGASASLLTGKAKVDVVVHHRGLKPVDGADVRVTLLHWIDPKSKKKANPDDSTTWFSGNVPWTAAVNEVLNSATAGRVQGLRRRLGVHSPGAQPPQDAGRPDARIRARRASPASTSTSPARSPTSSSCSSPSSAPGGHRARACHPARSGARQPERRRAFDEDLDLRKEFSVARKQ